MAKKAVTKKKGEYQVTISVNGEVQSFEVGSIREALDAFVVPAAIKTEVLINATHGERVKEEVLGTIQARRAFGGSAVALELLSSKIEKFITN